MGNQPELDDFISAAARYVAYAAPSLPSYLHELVCRMAATAELQGTRAITDDDQAQFDANQDWRWPEMLAVTPQPLGETVYQKPADPEAARQAQELVARLDELEQNPVANRLLQYQLRKALEELTGPPIPWHLRHLLQLTRRRLQAYRALHFSPDGPTFFKEVEAEILAATQAGSVMPAELVAYKLEEAFAAWFEKHDVEADAVLLAVHHGKRVLQQLEPMAHSRSRVQTELHRLEPVRLAVSHRCKHHRGDPTPIEPHEAALPPFSLTCQCTDIVWQGNTVTSQTERALHLWALSWLVNAHRRPPLPIELMLEHAGNYRPRTQARSKSRRRPAAPERVEASAREAA